MKNSLFKISNPTKYETSKIKDLWSSCFFEDSKEWVDWYFEYTYNKNNTHCLYINDEMLSMVHMNPYDMIIHSKHIKASAMAGVATYKEHRRNGYAGDLIRYSLRNDYIIGKTLSFLYPFSFAYYEKFGYKQSYDKYTYTYKYNDKYTAYEEIPMLDIGCLTQIYNQYCKKFNGYVLRDDAYTIKHFKEYQSDKYDIICFIVDNIKGYYIGMDTKEKYNIEEIIYNGDIQLAYESICKTRQKSVTYNLQPYNDMNKYIKDKHCMARIINLIDYFSGMKCKNASYVINVDDDIINENNGNWLFESNDNILKVTRVDDSYDISLDIGQLTQISIGYTKNLNKEAKVFASSIFQETTPFIIEVC